jgi:hypothetical protein
MDSNGIRDFVSDKNIPLETDIISNEKGELRLAIHLLK